MLGCTHCPVQQAAGPADHAHAGRPVPPHRPRPVCPPPSRPLCLPLNWDFAAGCWRPFCSGRGVKQGITEKAKARPAFYRGTIMNIDLVFKIAATGIIVAVLNQLLTRSGREDQAMMTTLAGLIVVLSMLVRQISDLFVLIKALFDL